jgi:FtsZ-interacting cell division protein ZipA
VPRVSDGKAAFERMLGASRQIAGAMDGVLVDAQRAPLADAMIAAIRAKIVELQQRMRDGGIDPGSPRALRLFS